MEVATLVLLINGIFCTGETEKLVLGIVPCEKLDIIVYGDNEESGFYDNFST